MPVVLCCAGLVLSYSAIAPRLYITGPSCVIMLGNSCRLRTVIVSWKSVQVMAGLGPCRASLQRPNHPTSVLRART